MATSRRVGNYAASAKAVADASAQIFDAGISGKPDFTKIAKEAIKGRSLERRAAIKAEADVASAGLKAFTDTNLTQMEVDSAKKIADIKRPAKRMAGIVGGLGAIAGGFVTMQGSKEDAKDREELKTMRADMKAKSDRLFAARDAADQQKIADLRQDMQGDSAVINTGPTKQVTPAKVDSPKPTSTGGGKTSKKFGDFVQMATSAGAKFPQLVAAQWALESGWGKTPSGKNNYFGIKAGSGEQGTSKQTWEVYGGKEVTTSARFKDFETPQGSVNEVVSRWHKDYKGYKGVNNASDAFAAADMLVSEGYATDPNYAKKLKRIMREQGF